MKHHWTELLWELWAAQAVCTAAVFPPGGAVGTSPGLALPGLLLAAAAPAAWAVWGVYAEPAQPPPPEQLLLCQPRLDPAALLDLPERMT